MSCAFLYVAHNVVLMIGAFNPKTLELYAGRRIGQHAEALLSYQLFKLGNECQSQL